METEILRTSKSADNRFVQFPFWIFKSGYWSRLKGAEIKVLGVLARRADNRTHVCRPTRKTIAQEAGICESSIGNITAHLAVYGIIKKWRQGNRVHYCVLFCLPPWIAERPNWTLPSKLPRKSASYLRDEQTGTFASENNGIELAELIEDHDAEEVVDCY